MQTSQSKVAVYSEKLAMSVPSRDVVTVGCMCFGVVLCMWLGLPCSKFRQPGTYHPMVNKTSHSSVH